MQAYQVARCKKASRHGEQNKQARGFCLPLGTWEDCIFTFPKVNSVLKSRDIILPTRVCMVKAMVFPVVTYGCERWTVKKSECQRIDAFELWCWRRCLKVPWTARRSNLSTLREINPEYSLERHAEAEAPAFWSSYENSQLIGRVPDAGKD